MIQPISIEAHGRKLDFKIDLDPSFAADAAIAFYLRQGWPCEPEVVQFMLRAVRPGDFVVDAGANVGFFTLLLAALVGETGAVLAVEPGPNNVDKLRKNIELNGFESFVEIGIFPLGAMAEDITFYVRQDSGLNSRWPGEGAKPVSESMVTFDSVLGTRVPRLIKLDIEGSEFEALRGLSSRPPFVICELNPKALSRAGATPSMVQLLMLQRGYDLYRLPDDGGLPARVPETAELKIARQNTNVLFALPHAFAELWTQVQL